MLRLLAGDDSKYQCMPDLSTGVTIITGMAKLQAMCTLQVLAYHFCHDEKDHSCFTSMMQVLTCRFSLQVMTSGFSVVSRA